MRHARRSPRHPLHDYRQPGLYFVTACTAGRQPVFGAIHAGEMHRSAFGDIAHEEWLRTGDLRPYVVMDAFVVMPDHVHLLFGLMGDIESNPRRRDTMHGVPTGLDGDAITRYGTNPAGSVSAIIGAYKAAVTRQIRQRADAERQLDPAARVWQPRFHDRVVRHPSEADALRRYIRDNPSSGRPSCDRSCPPAGESPARGGTHGSAPMCRRPLDAPRGAGAGGGRKSLSEMRFWRILHLKTPPDGPQASSSHRLSKQVSLVALQIPT